jgi:hypothetical protein
MTGCCPQIAAETGVSPATVSRVLRRLGLNKLSALEPAEPVRCYEREKPGELIHLDIKKLGRIGSVGHRITGRYPGAVNRHHGIGWEFVHVCIDDASRIALHRYNWHRPHGSLKANTPISRLGLSEDNLLRLSQPYQRCRQTQNSVVINIIVSLGICATNSIISPSWVTWGGASACKRDARRLGRGSAHAISGAITIEQ